VRIDDVSRFHLRSMESSERNIHVKDFLPFRHNFSTTDIGGGARDERWEQLNNYKSRRLRDELALALCSRIH